MRQKDKGAKRLMSACSLTPSRTHSSTPIWCWLFNILVAKAWARFFFYTHTHSDRQTLKQNLCIWNKSGAEKIIIISRDTLCICIYRLRTGLCLRRRISRKKSKVAFLIRVFAQLLLWLDLELNVVLYVSLSLGLCSYCLAQICCAALERLWMRRSTGHETAHLCAHLNFKHKHNRAHTHTAHKHTPWFQGDGQTWSLPCWSPRRMCYKRAPAKYAIENAALQRKRRGCCLSFFAALSCSLSRSVSSSLSGQTNLPDRVVFMRLFVVFLSTSQAHVNVLAAAATSFARLLLSFVQRIL